MRKYLMTALVVGMTVMAAPTTAFAQDAPRLFATVRPDPPITQPDRYLETHTVTLALETLHAPVERIVLNLPGREPEIVTLLHWEPRQGYIQIPDPNDPTGFNTITIPDPSTRPEDFHWRWYGRSANFTVGLTVEAGVVAGRVTGRADRYAIEPRGDGRITLGLSNGDFWQTHDGDREREQAQRLAPIVASQPASPAASNSTSAASSPLVTKPYPDTLPQPLGSAWDTDCTGPAPEGFQVIDVLQLYTEGLSDRYGDDLTALRPVLRESLDDANQALRNSGISNVIFSPRGPELLPDVPPPNLYEFDKRPIVEVLNRAAGITDVGEPDYFTFNENAYVPSRRNAMWADVVAVARNGELAGGTPSCGAAYINNVVRNNAYPTEPGGVDAWRFGYLVYDPGCNVDRLNLAHELGHLVGMEHDPANVASTIPERSCPWSFGHRRGYGDPQSRFRTVMAYPTPGQVAVGIPWCSDAMDCPQIDAYSTPLLGWADGLYPVITSGVVPIGVPVPPAPFLKPANGVDTIRRVAPTVAAYRPRPDEIFAHGYDVP